MATSPPNNSDDFSFDTEPLNQIKKALSDKRRAGEYSAEAFAKGRSSQGGPFPFGVEDLPSGLISPKPAFFADKVEPVSDIKSRMPLVTAPAMAPNEGKPRLRRAATVSPITTSPEPQMEDEEEESIAIAPSRKPRVRLGGRFSGGLGASTVNWAYGGVATAANQTLINQTHGTGAAHGMAASILGTVGGGMMAPNLQQQNVLGNIQLSLTAIVDLLNKILSALQNIGGLGRGGVMAQRPLNNKRGARGAGFGMPMPNPAFLAVAAGLGAFGSGAMSKAGRFVREKANTIKDDIEDSAKRLRRSRLIEDNLRRNTGGPRRPPPSVQMKRAAEDLKLQSRGRMASTLNKVGVGAQWGAAGYIALDEGYRAFGAVSSFERGDKRAGINNILHGVTDAGQFGAMSRSSTWGAAAAGILEVPTLASDIDMINNDPNMTQAEKDKAIHSRKVRTGVSLGEMGGIAALSLAKGVGRKSVIGAALIGAGELGYDAYQIHQIQANADFTPEQKARLIHETKNHMLESGGGTVGGIVGGMAGGALLGAAVGSIVPGVGTLIGGLVGGGIGAFAGSKAGHSLASKIEDVHEGKIGWWDEIKNTYTDAVHSTNRFMLPAMLGSSFGDARQAAAVAHPAANGNQGQSGGNAGHQIQITINNPVIKDLATHKDIENSLRQMLQQIFGNQYNNQSYSNVSLPNPTTSFNMGNVFNPS